MADSPDRIALPIRVHDFLLTCAGRIDDDALTDARELLADGRAGPGRRTGHGQPGRRPHRDHVDERDTLLDLVDAVRSSPALVDRIVVDDGVPLPRHRFTTGAMDDPSPEDRRAEAVGHVVEVLPDIRSVSCVWRTTPAGSTCRARCRSGWCWWRPARTGFAPSTAYRVEQALRRAGIRAAVEVVQGGDELTDYHGGALAVARRISYACARRSDDRRGTGDSNRCSPTRRRPAR